MSATVVLQVTGQLHDVRPHVWEVAAHKPPQLLATPCTLYLCRIPSRGPVHSGTHLPGLLCKLILSDSLAASCSIAACCICGNTATLVPALQP